MKKQKKKISRRMVRSVNPTRQMLVINEDDLELVVGGVGEAFDDGPVRCALVQDGKTYTHNSYIVAT